MTNFQKLQNFVFERNNAVPLYLQFADFLKSKIFSGEFSEGMRLPPESELADMLGIHRITLRKSLHVLSSQNLITQMPHRGTFIAPRKEKKIRVGIVFEPHIAGTYMTNLIYELEKAMFQYPAVEQVFIPLSDEEEQDNSNRIENAMCDALIVPFGREYLFQLLDQKKYDLLPIVFINRYNRQLRGMRYSVLLDTAAIRLGVDFLQEKGHRQIAYITCCGSNPVLTLRNREFQKLDSCNLTMYAGDEFASRFDFAREKTMELCRSGNPPTAIMTPGIAFTSGVWHGVLESGLKVPDDVSILGFDSMTDTYPMASTLDQPIAGMTEKAAALIQELCGGKTIKRHQFLYKAEIHDRGSIRQIEINSKFNH